MTKVKESIRTPRPARTRKPSKGQQVGYLRVSSLDQNEVRQLEGLDLNKTFTDKASGKDVKRPQLEAMQSFVAGSAARRWRGREWLRGWRWCHLLPVSSEIEAGKKKCSELVMLWAGSLALSSPLSVQAC